jgi:hypothetical protein
MHAWKVVGAGFEEEEEDSPTVAHTRYGPNMFFKKYGPMSNHPLLMEI